MEEAKVKKHRGGSPRKRKRNTKAHDAMGNYLPAHKIARGPVKGAKEE